MPARRASAWIPPGHEPGVRIWTTSGIEQHVGLIGLQIWKSIRDPRMHQLARAIVSGQYASVQLADDLIWSDEAQRWVPSGNTRSRILRLERGAPCGVGDHDCEIGRVFRFTQHNLAYKEDPPEVDTFYSASAALIHGSGDCFTPDTRVIVRSKASGCYEVRSLEELRTVWPAYDALSYDFSRTEWVFKPITSWRSKGVREICVSKLDNGPSFRHTPDHRVWWWDGQSPYQRVAEREIASRIGNDDRSRRRVLVARKIPALDVVDLTQAQAYLSGIYAAEGFASKDHRGDRTRVQIAQDKPEIRERIEHALTALGASYAPSARNVHAYYRFHTHDATAEWLLRQGTGSFDMAFAPEVLGGSEGTVRAAYEAHADGDAYHPKIGSTWEKKVVAIHATSSRDLVSQLQLMAMILGEAWHTQVQLRHGGVGTKPIYRFHRSHPDRQPSRRDVPELPGVGYSAIHEPLPAGEDEVVDIGVADTHNFVLENGMIAHNCDDFVGVKSTLLHLLGYTVGCEVISTDGKEYVHIYNLVGLPKHAPSRFIALDAAAPQVNPNPVPGWRLPACGVLGNSGATCATHRWNRIFRFT